MLGDAPGGSQEKDGLARFCQASEVGKEGLDLLLFQGAAPGRHGRGLPHRLPALLDRPEELGVGDLAYEGGIGVIGGLHRQRGGGGPVPLAVGAVTAPAVLLVEGVGLDRGRARRGGGRRGPRSRRRWGGAAVAAPEEEERQADHESPHDPSSMPAGGSLSRRSLTIPLPRASLASGGNPMAARLPYLQGDRRAGHPAGSLTQLPSKERNHGKRP